jgi:coenzyme F420-0:L-glutamate ligase/coenzyme F420-1:gamma-L-glutamate ligase
VNAAHAGGARQRDDDIAGLLVVAAFAQDRPCVGLDVQPSERARELARRCEKDPRVVELILQESAAVLRCRPGAIIVAHRLGLVPANAGIDASTDFAPQACWPGGRFVEGISNG